MASLVQQYYDRFRPFLPRRKGTYHGYVARDDRLLDLTTSRPDYKEGLVRALRRIAPGRTVCIVGFGRGITSMIATETGAKSVTSYEASREMVKIGLESFRINNVSANALTVNHALVGSAVDIYGSPEGAASVSPDDIDPKEVLVLECEGSELSILRGLSRLPDYFVVETHPSKGAPTAGVCRTIRE